MIDRAVQTTEHRVPSGRAGLSVLLRNKSPGRGGTPALFVHGATYPSTVMFDYAIDGCSWMDWMVRADFDVWCIDLLGYGGSDRPAEMSQPADQNGPIVDTAEAVADVKRAMDFILAERGAESIDLVGYSWGTAITAQIAGEEPQKVRRLVLGGAIWLRTKPSQIAIGGSLGAYRIVTAPATIKRWTIGLDESQKNAIAPPERFAQWAAAAIASDPDSSGHDPAQLRAPTGVVRDVQESWQQGSPTYDPSLIRCPVAVVVGEWDKETTPEEGRTVFEKLTGAAERRFTIIGGGTHSLLLENQRHQLYETVRGFLGAT
ncbi:MAG: alpha/beta hydrolase [Gammaproteobacteria bacterium]|nr:alpha/beta hydrolase [Gammaproteobacteria bacterium]